MKMIIVLRAIYTGLITGIIIAIPVGPAGIESIRWTITKGLKNGILIAAGSLISDTIDVMLINFGLLNLIETNKILEITFWMISGIIIFIIGYKAIKNGKNYNSEEEEEILEKKEIKSHPLLTGFIINMSNPMTLFFWFTFSSTVIRVWRYAGTIPYLTFVIFMLTGMFISLSILNYLASRGRKLTTPKFSGKLNILLSYGISAIGAGFFLYGLYVLLKYLKCF